MQSNLLILSNIVSTIFTENIGLPGHTSDQSMQVDATVALGQTKSAIVMGKFYETIVYLMVDWCLTFEFPAS